MHKLSIFHTTELVTLGAQGLLLVPGKKQPARNEQQVLLIFQKGELSLRHVEECEHPTHPDTLQSKTEKQKMRKETMGRKVPSLSSLRTDQA